MFRFTKKPLSGSHSQCLAKITRDGSMLKYMFCRSCQCYGGIEWTVFCVCCELCKRINLHSSQNGEPCHRSLERKDKPHEYSQAFSQRSNPKSIHKNTLRKKKLYSNVSLQSRSWKGRRHLCLWPPVPTIWAYCRTPFTNAYFLPEILEAIVACLKLHPFILLELLR